MQRLRCETATQHRNLENSLDLLRPDLTSAAYCQLLVKFAAIYRGWEPVMALLIAPEFPAWLPSRSRLGLLRRDLAFLRHTPADGNTITLPGVDDLPSALGAMYVMEGSTLGSQILERHFEQTLGVTPATGGAFFHGYGPGTGAMWREFASALDCYAERTGTQDRIVEGARSMFEIMQRELCGVPS